MPSESQIEMELRKLGLNEKEVKVYLRGLELGPASAKEISDVVKIPRATVYEIIKSLKEKGLFSEIKVKKKRKFVANSPREILGILRIKKREIEEKEREFLRIIAALEAKYLKEKGLRVFKGKKGIETFLEILSFTREPEIIIVNQNFLPIPEKKLKEIFEKIKKRLGKIEVKNFEGSFDYGLIVFDKIAIFPKEKEKCFLFE